MAENHTSHMIFHMIYGAVIVVLLLIIAGEYYHFHKQEEVLSVQRPMMLGRGRSGGMGKMGSMSMTVATPAPLTTIQQQQLTEGSSTATTQKTFDVNGGNFYFSPNRITVNKGDTVTINFKNDGGIHDFVIDDYEVKTDVISTGKTESFTFTADKSGTFQFYCSIPGHKAKGMVGTLIVQ